MGYGKIMSNCGVGMQRLFSRASSGLSKAKTNFVSMMREPGPKPYSKLTPEERIARDMEMFEMDERALQKHHKKMVKRYGPDYLNRLDDWW